MILGFHYSAQRKIGVIKIGKERFEVQSKFEASRLLRARCTIGTGEGEIRQESYDFVAQEIGRSALPLSLEKKGEVAMNIDLVRKRGGTKWVLVIGEDQHSVASKGDVHAIIKHLKLGDEGDKKAVSPSDYQDFLLRLNESDLPAK